MIIIQRNLKLISIFLVFQRISLLLLENLISLRFSEFDLNFIFLAFLLVFLGDNICFFLREFYSFTLLILITTNQWSRVMSEVLNYILRFIHSLRDPIIKRSILFDQISIGLYILSHLTLSDRVVFVHEYFNFFGHLDKILMILRAVLLVQLLIISILLLYQRNLLLILARWKSFLTGNNFLRFFLRRIVDFLVFLIVLFTEIRICKHKRVYYGLTMLRLIFLYLKNLVKLLFLQRLIL